MKAHTAAAARIGYVVGVTATAANIHDITEAYNLIREDDQVEHADRRLYTGCLEGYKP